MSLEIGQRSNSDNAFTLVTSDTLVLAVSARPLFWTLIIDTMIPTPTTRIYEWVSLVAAEESTELAGDDTVGEL